MSDLLSIFFKRDVNGDIKGNQQRCYKVNNDLPGLDNVLQEIGNYELNNDIVNNICATASVAFPKLIHQCDN